MKYTASRIVERAKEMADVKNTDFLSHEELTDLLNDGWKELYQLFINNGDKQFVKEVTLRNCGTFNGYVEYEIPFDLYQILSIKDEMTGFLLTRHTESEGNNSQSYEVVNDKIRVYGGAPLYNLTMTYYLTPLYLCYPNKTKDITLPSNIILDTISNSVLAVVDTNLVIYNIKTNETISNAAIPYDDSFTYVLGNGHVVAYGIVDDVGVITYFDYNGNQIFTGTYDAAKTIGTVKDWNGYVYISIDDKLYLMGVEQENLINAVNGLITPNYTISYDSENIYLSERIGAEEYVTIPNEDGIIKTFALNSLFDDRDAFIAFTNKGMFLYLIDNFVLLKERLDVYAPIVYGATNEGILTSNGTDYFLNDWVPDTLLNFPNELYITLLAANIAMRIISKQNAENAGLSTLYDNSMSMYLNSLGQNSDYYRIKDVY